MRIFGEHQWALILGGSSGLGLATAQKLAQSGMSICVIHRDRQGAMDRISEQFEKIRTEAPSFLSLNIDALSPHGQTEAIRRLREALGEQGEIHAFVHSIAYGNLKPIDRLDEEDLSRTIYSMGSSLLTWVQLLHHNELFASQPRIISFTSEGSQVAWAGYAAVSAAKAALEAISRAIAVEYAPLGFRSNIIQSGVCITPALKAIPDHERMVQNARHRNPSGRLTQAGDIANAVYLLCAEEASWINGALIVVDGGERIGTD